MAFWCQVLSPTVCMNLLENMNIHETKKITNHRSFPVRWYGQTIWHQGKCGKWTKNVNALMHNIYIYIFIYIYICLSNYLYVCDMKIPEWSWMTPPPTLPQRLVASQGSFEVLKKNHADGAQQWCKHGTPIPANANKCFKHWHEVVQTWSTLPSEPDPFKSDCIDLPCI